ncbi:MAG: hypothetical protein AB7S70_06330 [Hyphomicrobium sp.]|uniref:hypothetical protein n=1 Tax=Hyphomicrobium sp. TaxID=82 RepID=UPI003D13C1E0
MPQGKAIEKAVSAAAFGAAVAMGLVAGAVVARAESCVTKHGSATGVTRDFAEYEAFLIIRQVTGNWPFEQDRISKPVYKCKGDGALWTCSATATVCKG